MGVTWGKPMVYALEVATAQVTLLYTAAMTAVFTLIPTVNAR